MTANTSMFASLEDIPTTMGGGHIFKKMKPTSKGVPLPALPTLSPREFKKKYDKEPMAVSTKGFTVFVALKRSDDYDDAFYAEHDNSPYTPSVTYLKFTVGETPTYSFYFGSEAPSYNFLTKSIKIKAITIDKKIDRVQITFDDDSVSPFAVSKGVLKWSYATKTATNGFFFQEPDVGSASCLVSVAPYNVKNATLFRENYEQLEDVVDTLVQSGQGLYFWEAEDCEVFYSPQSFTFDSSLDSQFLLPPKSEFDPKDSMDMKSQFISFTVAIENKQKRTNNYTGKHLGDSSLLVALQFPGDEELLAPMGIGEDGTTVACGMDSLSGRVFKSITPFMKNGKIQQVKMEFQDGSHYIFPDAETGLFTATDKQFPDQMLEGKVMELISNTGSPRDALAKEVQTRIENNIDISKTVMVDGDVKTKAIAWKTFKPSMIKVLVPNPDGEGSKLITIPLTKGA